MMMTKGCGSEFGPRSQRRIPEPGRRSVRKRPFASPARASVLFPIRPNVGDDSPVAQGNHASASLGDELFMCDHDHRPAVAAKVVEDIEDFLAGLGIQIPRGLVSQHDHRVVDQRPRDGRALLLPTRQLRRSVVASVGEVHACGQLAGLLATGGGWNTLIKEGDFEILQDVELWNQVEALEYEADIAAANLGEVVVVKPADVGFPEHVSPGRRSIQTTQEVHKRALARSALAADRDRHPLLEVDGNAPEGLDANAAARFAVGLSELFDGRNEHW